MTVYGVVLRTLFNDKELPCPSNNSYKTVKGRSHNAEKRLNMHPHKPHATSQPSPLEQRFSAALTPRREYTVVPAAIYSVDTAETIWQAIAYQRMEIIPSF